MKNIVFTPSTGNIFIVSAVKMAALLSKCDFVIVGNDHFIRQMAEFNSIQVKPLGALDSPAYMAFVDPDSSVFRFGESPITVKVDFSLLQNEDFIHDLARFIHLYSMVVTDPGAAGYIGQLVYALVEHRQSCVEAESAKRRVEKDLGDIKKRFNQTLCSEPVISIFGKLAQDDPHGLFADWAHGGQPVEH